MADFSFDDGNRFEPDFILFLRKKGSENYLQEQIYIEAKGSYLLEADKWKEDFLAQIELQNIPTKKYVDDHKYKIIGLPFYNRQYRMDKFSEKFKKLIN